MLSLTGLYRTFLVDSAGVGTLLVELALIMFLKSLNPILVSSSLVRSKTSLPLAIESLRDVIVDLNVSVFTFSA